MGESFSTKEILPIQIEVEGTGKIAQAEIFMDGKSEKTFRGKTAKESFRYQPENLAAGAHIFTVHVKQDDGNRAWSSPIWIDLVSAK
jgi:hypothetical protein